MDDNNEWMAGTSVNRRTALKVTAAGIVGSTFVPEVALASGEEMPFDATFHLFDSILDVLGDPAPRLINITENPSTGQTITMHGSGIFAQDGTDISGGGSFLVRDEEETIVEEGTWIAEQVVEWDPYGPGETLPEQWKGGYLELEASFSPRPDGISAADSLIIECHEGGDEDELRFDVQGVRVGDFDTITPTNFATIFHFDQQEGMETA